MNMDLDSLRALVCVAEEGSFHEAARVLHLSQPALSRRIQKLERQAGTRLIERNTRNLRLTAVGREFLPRARALVDEFAALRNELRGLSERRTGTVTVACIPTAAYHFLPSVIAAYNRRCPENRVRILDVNANEGLAAVIRGEAEIGINLLGSQDPEIEFEPMIEDPLVLVCHREHPLAKKRKVAWRDLEPYRVITVGRSSGNRMLLDFALARLPVRLQWFYEVQHLFWTAMGLVEARLAVAAAPRLACPRHRHSALVSRPLLEPAVSRTLGLIRRKGAVLSPAAEDFVTTLRESWPRRT
jgi:DNA-binding transcriptional LysR family regulator